MMDDSGTVVGIEHIPELFKKGVKNVAKSHQSLIDSKKIILLEGDGRKGAEEYGPFNCIHVGAGKGIIKRLSCTYSSSSFA
jgi:protein-L-isoaspartate(D-aspartate) O-methyltransferase